MSETIEAAAPEAGTADDDLRDNAPVEAVDTQDDGAETPAEEQPEAVAEEPEEVELSFGAKTLKVAKSAIPESVLSELEEFTKGVQGDYTRKTQEVAEQRKEVEAKRELFEKLSTLKGEALSAFSAGQRLASEIQQLEQIDLNAVWQSDPDQARRIGDALSIKRAEFQKYVNAVSAHEAAMEAEQQRAIAKLEEAGRAEMRRVVKGFDENAEREMVAYAVKNGIDEQDAKRWPLNPKTAQMAWKAMQFDKLQAQTKAATAAKPPPAPAAPVKSVAGKVTAAPRNPDQMSDEEYYRWEMAQHVKNRRR
jgi:hypothetical protein